MDFHQFASQYTFPENCVEFYQVLHCDVFLYQIAWGEKFKNIEMLFEMDGFLQIKIKIFNTKFCKII